MSVLSGGEFKVLPIETNKSANTHTHTHTHTNKTYTHTNRKPITITHLLLYVRDVTFTVHSSAR